MIKVYFATVTLINGHFNVTGCCNILFCLQRDVRQLKYLSSCFSTVDFEYYKRVFSCCCAREAGVVSLVVSRQLCLALCDWLPLLQLFSVIRRWPAGPSEVFVSASACECMFLCVWVSVSGRPCKGVIKKVSGRGVGKIQQPAVLLHTLHPGPTSGPMCHPSVICSVPTVSCVFSALTCFLFSF